MKISAKIYLYLVILAVLSSCASRPVTTAASTAIETTTAAVIPASERALSAIIEIPVPLSPIEQIIEIIKENGADIGKYFILDENRRIVVKADLQLNAENFEVTYNLDEAGELGNSVYEVGFTVLEKETGLTHESVLIWRPVAGNAGILLSFDDDYHETWEQYLDFFDEYGAKVTFFIMGEYIPFSSTAIARGHDVGFHTLNHLDLRQLSITEFYHEAIESAQSFRQAGVPVSSLAYPYGFSEQWMHEILLQHYSVLRGYGTTFRLYNGNEIGESHIISRAIDNTVLQGEDNFDRNIRIMLRTVKFMDKNWVLPITSHDISNAAWAIRHRRLEFLLQTTMELGLKFYKFSDFD